MTLREVRDIALEQLACDYCCAPGDFLKHGNTVAVQRGHTRARKYAGRPAPFGMCSFGDGVVVSVRPDLYDWAARAFCEPVSYHAFEACNIVRYARALEPFGLTLADIFDYYLFDPSAPCPAVLPDGFALRWYDCGGIEGELYADPAKPFDNALLYGDAFRRDVLAVAAVAGGRVAALAGASDDGQRMWQVGVDVLPEYRGAGLGQHLVYTLSREIDRLGMAAFYSTWAAHTASRTVAHRCGYVPGFVELM